MEPYSNGQYEQDSGRTCSYYPCSLLPSWSYCWLATDLQGYKIFKVSCLVRQLAQDEKTAWTSHDVFRLNTCKVTHITSKYQHIFAQACLSVAYLSPTYHTLVYGQPLDISVHTMEGEGWGPKTESLNRTAIKVFGSEKMQWRGECFLMTGKG